MQEFSLSKTDPSHCPLPAQYFSVSRCGKFWSDFLIARRGLFSKNMCELSLPSPKEGKINILAIFWFCTKHSLQALSPSPYSVWPSALKLFIMSMWGSQWCNWKNICAVLLNSHLNSHLSNPLLFFMLLFFHCLSKSFIQNYMLSPENDSIGLYVIRLKESYHHIPSSFPVEN